ncbi:MAG: flagellar hook-basal body complex protein FliE [Pseudomonadota bacterium]|nr:flagellar hook-basal body complex protein FliE [Pseudomonadota bacterium]
MMKGIQPRADIQQVLDQMRSMRADLDQARRATATHESSATPAASGLEAGGFGAALRGAVEGVNQQQQAASALAASYERGAAGVDITQVMVALQKSRVSFEAMTQVRNKLVDAYETIMNMPV